MKKVKCLFAVKARKTQACGRKESQQREALAQVNLHYPGELKTVLFISVKKDLHCAELRAPSPQLLTRYPFFGAKRGRDTKMHRTLWGLPHFVTPRSGVEKQILLPGPADVPGRGN